MKIILVCLWATLLSSVGVFWLQRQKEPEGEIGSGPLELRKGTVFEQGRVDRGKTDSRWVSPNESKEQVDDALRDYRAGNAAYYSVYVDGNLNHRQLSPEEILRAEAEYKAAFAKEKAALEDH